VESFLGIMTRGQALCLPMIIGGGLIMAWAYNRSKSAVHQ
ncbi:MAG: prolipoprotein diacylglyceryl transferase, partial [Haemophilus parainfluenzae]|nr:prolipoprotein diacylglyceryl transferase [Haemophilus parainfluenzae]